MSEVERGEWIPVGERELEPMLGEGREIAKKSLSKSGRISIRITDNDL
ncbi:MAG: hypothetical protein OEY59_11975 [Deltaproteobacteria bacterium]|nr:hypothetical protein [Deltaproteobacteria bacterium]